MCSDQECLTLTYFSRSQGVILLFTHILQLLSRYETQCSNFVLECVYWDPISHIFRVLVKNNFKISYDLFCYFLVSIMFPCVGNLSGQLLPNYWPNFNGTWHASSLGGVVVHLGSCLTLTYFSRSLWPLVDFYVHIWNKT